MFTNKGKPAEATPSLPESTQRRSSGSGRGAITSIIANGVKITGSIEADGAEVQVDGEIDGNMRGGAVTVGDTGIGMNPEDLEVAFKPFAQVDNRLERRYEGTGLGLPLTKALVDLHKGSIHIDSARGRGTRITVTFPRARAQEMQQAG